MDFSDTINDLQRETDQRCQFCHGTFLVRVAKPVDFPLTLPADIGSVMQIEYGICPSPIHLRYIDARGRA